ncbi:ROK family protein [Actinomyces faecalis]|uniref:ROK family protein n=1 Tax=Actinomyces faecalis TaxID=2722820 RepID=UPI001555EEA0|nr:ROK family protein [Actinomyces faecalis]
MSTRDRSRPGTEEEPLLVGVDLGGTKIAAALVSVTGQLRSEVRQVATPGREGPAAMLDAIAGLVVEVVAAGDDGGRSPRPLAVGIGSAGVIDARSGVVLSATDAITGWPGTNVADGVARLLPERGVLAPGGAAPLVHVDNDVNAYAAGEAWLGAGHGASSALVVAVGTGVGGALVLGGAVHHGAHFLAGEMGHMPCEAAAGEPCTCGKPGHLEAVAAGPQIARRYREATGDTSVTTALEVERRARAGDAVAQRVYEEAAVALGRGIAQVVTAVDPERVIISGGLARSGDLWWQPLRRTVADELIDLISGTTELLPATLGTTAPVIGAAHEAWLRLPQAVREGDVA